MMNSLLFQVIKDKSWNLLHRAAAKNYFPRVKKLCESTTVPGEVDAQTMEGLTPLMLAAHFGSVESFLILLKAGANAEAKSKCGLSIIQIAAASGHIGVIISIQKELSLPWDRLLKEVSNFIINCKCTINMYTQALSVMESLLQTFIACHSEVDFINQILLDLNVICMFEKSLMRCLQEQMLPAATESVCKAIKSVIPLQYEEISQSKIPYLLATSMMIIDDVGVCYNALTVIAEIIKLVADSSLFIFALGGPLTLFKLLQKHNNNELHIAVMNCIAEGGTNPKLAIQFNTPEIIDGFMSVLSSSNDGDTLAATINALQCLFSSCAQISQYLINKGIVSTLLKLLRPFDKAFTEQIVKLLRCLCQSKNVTDKIKESPEAVKVLLHITKHDHEAHLQQMTFEILWHTTGDSLIERRLLSCLLGPDCLVALANICAPEKQVLFLSALNLISPAVHNLQYKIISSGGILLLIKTLSNNSSETAKILALKTLENLSYNVALQPNMIAQVVLKEVNGLQVLLHLYQHDDSDQIKIQSLCTITSYSAQNKSVKDSLLSITPLPYLLAPLQSQQVSISIAYTRAIANLAYQSNLFQSKMRVNGGILVNNFLLLISNGDKIEKVEIAFQMIVLAQIISNSKPVNITLFALRLMKNALRESIERGIFDYQVVTVIYISALIRMRAGLAGAFLSLDLIPLLTIMLKSQLDDVKRVSAVCLSLFSYNAEASRQILKIFRLDADCYVQMMQYNNSFKPSQQFKEGWKAFCKMSSQPTSSSMPKADEWTSCDNDATQTDPKTNSSEKDTKISTGSTIVKLPPINKDN